jgi:serine phosphatase RsbU (regulator of sigma subunit)
MATKAPSPQKKFFIDRILFSSFKDYEFLMTMSLKAREYAAFGYIILSLNFGILLHFTIRTPLEHSPNYGMGVIIAIYGWAVMMGLGLALVFLIPSLLYKRWYHWCYLAFSAISGGLFSFTKIGKTVDMLDIVMFTGGIIVTSKGLNIFMKATSALADEKVILEREKAIMQTEIAAAQMMQAALLPVIDVETPHYCVYGKTVSATEVGGDYFDVVPLQNGNVALAIGDVSGHNITAGLLMAMTKSAFRTELKHSLPNAPLTDVLHSLNQTVLESTSRRMFVSFECAVFDIGEKKVHIANAGHGLVARFRDGRVHTFQSKGMALGLAAKGVFSEETSDLQPNDVFLFFTDGIIEAMNTEKEEFGLERVEKIVMNVLADTNEPANPRKIYDSILSTVQAFTNTSSFEDDATLVVVRVV